MKSERLPCVDKAIFQCLIVCSSRFTIIFVPRGLIDSHGQSKDMLIYGFSIYAFTDQDCV
jgi:hypothetical protein